VSDRYLWDKGGAPDPEVERLERLLGPLAHRGAPLARPEAAVAPVRPAWTRRPALAWGVAAAAVVVAVLGTALLLPSRGWRVQALAGVPRVGAAELSGAGRVTAGQWIVTDAAASARLDVGTIGMVELGPRSRLQVKGTGARQHRLALAEGSLLAAITAPPRRFVVETPSATAVDLGCVYTLEVDPAGNATLTVMAGWVSFEEAGRETFVPAGARCRTRTGSGPGTPYFTDAAPAFKNALAVVDLAPAAAAGAALDTVLATSRREDAFTLWHLLVGAAPPERPRIADRLAGLVPMPDGVTRPGVLAGDPAMLDRWWGALGFGGTADWRRWQGPWPGATTGR